MMPPSPKSPYFLPLFNCSGNGLTLGFLASGKVCGWQESRSYMQDFRSFIWRCKVCKFLKRNWGFGRNKRRGWNLLPESKMKSRDWKRGSVHFRVPGTTMGFLIMLGSCATSEGNVCMLYIGRRTYRPWDSLPSKNAPCRKGGGSDRKLPTLKVSVSSKEHFSDVRAQTPTPCLPWTSIQPWGGCGGYRKKWRGIFNQLRWEDLKIKLT